MLHTWKTLGIPHFLQLDNDAVFNGGYKAPRIFGQFVRLCLSLGIELIFLPVAEPERIGDIERLNRLWNHAFFDRRHFCSVAHVQRTSPEFVQWYLSRYAPPKLGEQTPQQAQRAERRCRLTQCQVAELPEPLPITDGRIHFLRKVSADGTITLFNESWRVNRRLAGKYVWATVTTHQRRLDIWYQRAAQPAWRLLMSFTYDISETAPGSTRSSLATKTNPSVHDVVSPRRAIPNLKSVHDVVSSDSYLFESVLCFRQYRLAI